MHHPGFDAGRGAACLRENIGAAPPSPATTIATPAGEIKPRSVLILVEWQSKEAFDSYCNDPALADLHPHRVNGTSDYVWHLFDKLEDLRPILK